MTNKKFIEAYEMAIYLVDGENSFHFSVGCFSKEIEHLYKKFNYKTAAFLTAYNPKSVFSPFQKNKMAQKCLEEELKNQPFRSITGRGLDPSNEWPAEESVFVLGISAIYATIIAKRYRQNAFIWIGPKAVPRLKLIC